jgi:hypothetical protein
MTRISEIQDPLERYLAFIVERDQIYQRKQAGIPWPWTTDTILSSYRFTEIYRERDRTSLHYQKTIRDRYGDGSFVLPATVLYRWFNRMETCDHFFNQPDFGNQSVFERYIETGDLSILQNCLERIPTPHVTGAFIINGKPGYMKGDGVLFYFHEWCQKQWLIKWNMWRVDPPTLQEMYDWLREDCNGLGPFMAAQLVADLKYVQFMQDVEDWWTWAAPGPGSQKGLNVVLGRPFVQPWNAKEWLLEIQNLRSIENEMLEPKGLGPFHAQDTQNHCCEFSKYTKVSTGTGRPRQVYRV